MDASQIFAPAAEFVTSPIGVSLLGGAIVVWAVWAFLRFLSRIRPLNRDFQRCCDLLKATQDDEEFAAEFLELRQAFRESAVLGHSWMEFEETLVDPTEEDERQVIRNPYPADRHFNRRALLGPSVNLRLYNALPNFFTGAGILGTFIGLVAGIYLASSGLGSADVDQAKGALQDLLHGASLAFLTSIAGLFSSIIFSSLEKHLVHRFDTICNQWVEALDARLERVTPERLAIDALRESRQQTLAMQQFSNDLAFQIAEAFESKVAQELSPMLSQTVTELQQMRAEQSQASDETLERLIGEFSETIRGAAGSEMQAFAETVNSMSTGLQEQIGAMADSHREMQEASQRTVQELTDTFRDSSRQLNEELTQSVRAMVGEISETVAEMTRELKRATEQTTANMNQIVERFDESVAKLRRSITEIHDVTANTRQVTDGLGQLIDAVKESQQGLAQTAEPIRTAGEQFAATAASMGRASENMERSTQALGHTLEKLAGMQEEIRDAWNAYEERFGSVDQSLERVFEQLDDGLKRYAETTRDYMVNLDEHAAKVVRNLAGAVSTLQETVEEFNEVRTETGS